MIRPYRCDLHLHTCLSPCAELDMHPRALIDKCIENKLDIVAITDHNASENVIYCIRAAAGKPLRVLPGMEVSSREEVHILALFETIEALALFQEFVYARLPGENREEIFGCQAIVNENGEVEGFNPRLLIGATEWSLGEVIQAIHDRQGLAIASHINRESFSVIGQLGFIDPAMPFDALEVTGDLGISGARRHHPDWFSRAVITSSDAHFLRDVGKGATLFHLNTPEVEELRRAFQGREGRMIEE